MFNRETLELLDDLIAGREVSTDDRARLQRIITGALWSTSRHLSKKERVLIEEAEREGRVARYGMFESGLPDENGKPTFVPVKPKGPDRLKPAAMLAKDGDELLKGLGINL